MASESARITPITEPNDEQRRLLAKSVIETSPAPPNLFSTLVAHPTLMRRVNALGGVFIAEPSISVRERELLILRVAARASSQYELHQHRILAARAGLSAEEIRTITDDPGAATGRDRTLLAFADAVLTTRDVSDELWNRVRSETQWTDVQLLEILVMIGFYGMLGAVLNVCRVPLDDLGDPSI